MFTVRLAAESMCSFLALMWLISAYIVCGTFRIGREKKSKWNNLAVLAPAPWPFISQFHFNVLIIRNVWECSLLARRIVFLADQSFVTCTSCIQLTTHSALHPKVWCFSLHSRDWYLLPAAKKKTVNVIIRQCWRRRHVHPYLINISKYRKAE